MNRILLVLSIAFAFAGGTVYLSGCRVYSLPLWHPVEPRTAATCEVAALRDIAYRLGPEADSSRNVLDLYLPHGKRDFPVVVVVHGGGWIVGDKRSCGLYANVGDFFARHGIAAVMPNYRLSPSVKHPEHAHDVACAVAWTKAHIAEHGGRPDRIFLAGHSAGGHLAALVGTDDTYLRAEGLTLAELRGVIGISGVYRIPDGAMDVTFGGDSAKAFRFDEIMPIRGDSDLGRPKTWPEIPLSVDVFAHAFGNDPQTRATASPITHAKPGLPPFLLVAADHDLPSLPTMAEEFHTALREQGVDSQLLRAENRNHNTVIFRAIEERDPVARAMLDFIARHD